MVIQFFFPTFEGTLIKLYICVCILYKKNSDSKKRNYQKQTS